MHNEARLKLSCIVGVQAETDDTESIKKLEVKPSCIFGAELRKQRC